MQSSDINTLILDIQRLLKTRGWFDAYSDSFGMEITSKLKAQFAIEERSSKLSLSKMGPRCPKALWHSVNTPHLGEELPPWVEVKFSLGHMLEAFAIACAKAAGHRVEGEQDELSLLGIKGHRDCVIDGCTVDVKSLSSRAFLKLKQRTLEANDSFGYLDQLDGYGVASRNDPLVITKDRAYLFGIDKTLGHMVCYEHTIRESSIRNRVQLYKSIVEQDHPPACTCGTRPDGKSGNMALDVRGSYDPFKYCCHPNLRTFLYSDGPRYLTHVVREPEVPEINRYGKIV